MRGFDLPFEAMEIAMSLAEEKLGRDWSALTEVEQAKRDTKRALIEIARALDANPDVLADNLLRIKMLKEYPQVFLHMGEQSMRTEAFRKELKLKLNPTKL